jgi:hypothetical protein
MLTFLHPNLKLRTDEGWVAIKDYKQGNILCINEEKKLYWSTPKGTSKYPFYYGPMNKLSWVSGEIHLKPSTLCLTPDNLSSSPKELYSIVSKNMDVELSSYTYGDSLYSVDFDESHLICVLFHKDYIFIKNGM